MVRPRCNRIQKYNSFWQFDTILFRMVAKYLELRRQCDSARMCMQLLQKTYKLNQLLSAPSVRLRTENEKAVGPWACWARTLAMISYMECFEANCWPLLKRQ